MVEQLEFGYQLSLVALRATVVTVVSELIAFDHPQNRDLLDYLREHARPRPSGRYSFSHLDGWELHTHPDLIDRLKLVAPHGYPLISLFGVPVLAANGIVGVAALGTSWLMVKIPELPPDVRTKPSVPPLTDQGWHAVDAWQDTSTETEGHWRLLRLAAAALRHVGDLA